MTNVAKKYLVKAYDILTIFRLALLYTEQQKHQTSVTSDLSLSAAVSFIPMATTRLLILITTS